MRAAKVYCELRPKEIRIFAYELAQKYKSAMPLCQWEKSKMASKDWFSNCMRRRSTIIVYSTSRAHQSISCTSFNEINVDAFENLKKVLDDFQIRGEKYL
jgi:hypothetical protein